MPSSQTGHTVAAIPLDKQNALGDVLDRWRLNQGWNPWDHETQMMAIASWVSVLDREDIPASAYNELYERALETRAHALKTGKQLPNFGAELLLAEWIGEGGFRRELRQREIDSGRSLTSNVQSRCQRCFGTNMEHAFDADGNNLGIIQGKVCDHRPAAEGEKLFPEPRLKAVG